MPRGGKRLGAGRKPLTRREKWLGGKAGHRPLALVGPPASGAAVVADESVPNVLTEAEASYWALWAPSARANGMLHPHKEPGFVLLCQQAAFAASIRACIESRGYEQEKVTIDGAGQEHREYKANSLISQWRGLMARIEQLQARYGIAADGKVPIGEGEEDTEDAQLARLLAVK
jgi:hypothetical protein